MKTLIIISLFYLPFNCFSQQCSYKERLRQRCKENRSAFLKDKKEEIEKLEQKLKKIRIEMEEIHTCQNCGKQSQDEIDFLTDVDMLMGDDEMTCEECYEKINQ